MRITTIIKRTKGKIFSVRFVKRTTGEIRDMVCRTGVHKYLNGGTLPFSPKEKHLFVVYDFQKKAYRMINLDGVLKIKCGRVLYERN